jgi:hypothetical protein
MTILLFSETTTECVHAIFPKSMEMESHTITFSFAVFRNAYNRARAAQMFPDEALDDFVHNRLFKEHTYGYNPRGLWNEILSGVRGHMVKFYNSWYQPSNGRVFCYGAPKFVNACLDAVDEAVTRKLEDQVKKTEEAGGVSVLDELGLSLPEDSNVGFKMLNTIKSIEERVPYPVMKKTRNV